MSSGVAKVGSFLNGYVLFKKDRLKSWLALGDVPKISISVAGGLLGYLTTTGSSLKSMAIITSYIAFMHYFLFSLNDVYDFTIDRNGSRTEKPIVNGSINLDYAKKISYIGIGIGLIISPFVLPKTACVILGIGTSIGVLYNQISNVTPYGPVLLGIWGICDVAFGAYIASTPTTNTLFIAALVGVILIHITYVGDILDINRDIYTFPHYLGVSQTDGQISYPMNAIFFEIIINLLKIGLLGIIIFVGNVVSVIAIAPLFIHLLYNYKYIVDDSNRKYNVRQFTQTGVTTFILAVLAYSEINVVAPLLVITLLWTNIGSIYAHESLRAADF